MPRSKILTPEERYRELTLYFFDHIDSYGEFTPKNFKPSINRGTTRDSLFIDLLENEDTVRSVLSNQGEVEMLGNLDQPINALIDHMKNELSRHSIKYLEDYNYLKGMLKTGDIELIRDTLQREKSDDTESVSELKKRPSYKLLIKQLEEKIQDSEGIDFADDDGEFSDGWEDVNEIEPREPEPEPEPEHLNESLRLSPRSEQGSESESGSESGSGSDEGPARTFPRRTRSTLSPRRRSQAMDESRGRPAEPGFGERLLKCLDRNCAPRASHTKKKKKHTKKKKKQTKKKKKQTKKKKKQTKKKQTRTSRRRRN